MSALRTIALVTGNDSTQGAMRMSRMGPKLQSLGRDL